jgi:predicted metalloendopeptidase
MEEEQLKALPNVAEEALGMLEEDQGATEGATNSFDLIDLITSAENEKKLFHELASFKPVDKEKIAKRCSPFPYNPSKAIHTELYNSGFEWWVAKTVKGSVPQKAIIDQTGQFIAFCSDQLKRKLK